MSFEIKQTDDGEQLEEITTHETRKIWSKQGLQDSIDKIASQIEELQARKALLESQLTKFTKEAIKE